jgi:acyl-CoA synthetase (NDP forming)
LITISGGDCSLLSDICERVGLTLPDLDAETRRIVAQELKKDSFLGNPLDVEDLLLSNTDGFYGSVEAFAKMPAFGAIGVRLNIPEKLSDSLRQAYSRIADIVRLSGKQVVFFSRASEQMDRAWFDLFSSLQVPFLLEYEKGLKTLRAAIGSAQRWARPVQSLSINGERRIPENLKQMLSFHPGGPLPIRSALALFQEYGLPFAYTELARTAEEAKELAQKIGFPVVVKSASVEIPHRSEIGAVRINLKTPSDVEGAYDEVMAKCKEAHPGARLEGVAVQPMIQGVAEVILGVSRDPQLGPVILLGIGGIFVEVLKDVVLRVPPLDTQDCWEMVESLRGKALLFGARGRPRADIEELTQAILAVSRLALDFRQEIEELDLNPVVVCAEGKGVVAVDGLVVMRTDSEAIDEG